MWNRNRQPRILVFDIENAPITSYTWGLHDQNIGLGMVKKDWHFLAWAAKWYGDPVSKVMYMDNRGAKNIEDDKALIVGLAKLVNEADIVITQNGDAFDIKKLNARAIIHGLKPIKPVRSVDILKEGRKVFKFTSHKLEYITSVLNRKYKKLDHKEYPGFALWAAILKGDRRAWKVMQKYCIYDVLSTEEAYQKMQGWIKTADVSSYTTSEKIRCHCGSDNLQRRGLRVLTSGKYQSFSCNDCGKWLRGATKVADNKNKLRSGR